MNFKTFIPLPSNELALKRSKLKVKEILQNTKYKKRKKDIEPLLISTEMHGLGASHLLQSIKSNLADLNVISTYGQRFLYPYAGDIEKYCQYLRNGEVLLIEDIHHLFQEEIDPENSDVDSCGSYGLERSYVHKAYEYTNDVISSYYNQGKAVVLTTTESCSELEKLFMKKIIPAVPENKVIIQIINHKEKLTLLNEWKKNKHSTFISDKQINEIANNEWDNISNLKGDFMRLVNKSMQRI